MNIMIGLVYMKRGNKELNQDWFKNYEEVIEKKRTDNIKKTMFAEYSEKNNSLHFTARILPNQNNTGGFYLAMFQRKKNSGVSFETLTKELSLIKVNVETSGELASEAENNEEMKDNCEIIEDVEPIDKFIVRNILDNAVEDWNNIVSYYGLKADFSAENLYFIHSTKRICMINKPMLDFIKTNEEKNIRLVTMGLKIFEKIKDEECESNVIFSLTLHNFYHIVPSSI